MKTLLPIVRLFFVALLTIALFNWSGCEKNTVQPQEQPLQLSQAAQEGLVGGWQALHSINTVSSAEEMVKDDVPVDATIPGGTYSLPQLNKKISPLLHSSQAVLSQPGFRKVTGDSLLWFQEKTDPVTGITIRRALYYNDSTGHGRYYEVKFNFPASVQMQYDSTEIQVDLNFTPLNITDDRFIKLYQLTEYKPGFHLLKAESEAIATDYGVHNKITGAILHHKAWYAQGSDPKMLTQELEINPDKSGHITEQLDYWDGTYFRKQVNFYADYTGDFTEHWRDNTSVTGTFDRLINDNHGQFTRTVQFPSGHDPVSTYQFADITLEPADSSISMIFKEKINFASGSQDTSRTDVHIYVENQVKKTHIRVWRSSGEQCDLTVSKSNDYEEINGFFIGSEGYYTTIYSIRYSDGSGELWLKIWENETAYQNGDDPLVVIHIVYNPDGTGSGKLSEGGKDYTVFVAQDGKMTVSDTRGHSQTINGY